MKKYVILFISSIATLTGNAQTFGHLTIFSDDGDPFTLVLNGETINDAPQTNLRVEELTQPYYNAKIIFEDAAKSPITKTLQLTDVDNVYKDVTYKIRRDKNNAKKMKLSYFSETDVRPDFIAPSNVRVVHYGQPAPVVTQTTTTTTSGVPVMNAGVSMQGVGVNISINDPMLTQSTTVQTTTTTIDNGAVEVYSDPSDCSRNRGMNSGDFSGALNSLQKQNFDDSQLKLAKTIATANCLSAQQIKQMCSTFKFEESKLAFAKFAYSRCIDQNAYYKINDVFTFSSSGDELNNFIGGN